MRLSPQEAGWWGSQVPMVLLLLLPPLSPHQFHSCLVEPLHYLMKAITHWARKRGETQAMVTLEVAVWWHLFLQGELREHSF